MELLLIEDNPDHVFLCQEAIQGAWPDAILHTVQDVSEAHARIANGGAPQHVDVILASLDQHSQETLTRLRELQSLLPSNSAPIPLILMVSSTREQQLAQVADHPRNWILIKPLQADTLRAMLEPKESE